MSLMRWDPFKELEDVSQRLNRVFGLQHARRDADKDTLTAVDWAPMVDIAETSEEYQIKAELPEMKKEDIRVAVDGNTLTIEGERKQEKEEKGKRFHRVERSYGTFLRSFTLPDNVDDSHVQADYRDGVLNIRLPKSAKAKPKQVQVKVS